MVLDSFAVELTSIVLDARIAGKTSKLERR